MQVPTFARPVGQYLMGMKAQLHGMHIILDPRVNIVRSASTTNVPTRVPEPRRRSILNETNAPRLCLPLHLAVVMSKPWGSNDVQLWSAEIFLRRYRNAHAFLN